MLTLTFIFMVGITSIAQRKDSMLVQQIVNEANNNSQLTTPTVDISLEDYGLCSA